MTSSGKRGGNGAEVNRRAADARAKALAAIFSSLKAAGFVSAKAIARELNARGVPAAQGGRWHPTSVARLLDRLRKRKKVVHRAPHGRQGRGQIHVVRAERRRIGIGDARANLST
ncbi:MAG: recombinase family protein [Alphaproteobacteria bacterium]|nr:recombinase family protein [Alphaproteobacteria bacterium]